MSILSNLFKNIQPEAHKQDNHKKESFSQAGKTLEEILPDLTAGDSDEISTELKD